MSDNEEDDFVPPPPDEPEEDNESTRGKGADTKLGDERSENGTSLEQEGNEDDDTNGATDDIDDDERDDGDDQDEQDDGDDEGDEGEDDEDDEVVQKSSAKQKRKRADKPSKKSKRRGVGGFKFFSDEADEDDAAEDEDEDYDRGDGDQILDKDEQAAIDAVEKRHKANREYLDRSADDLAADFERRAKQEKRMKAKFEAGDGLAGATGSVQQTLLEQQSLLPSVMDPKIFKLKCKPGNELLLVRSVMLKAIDMRNKGGLLKIKSAFCSGVKGLIYVEALSEAFAKEVIMGLRMIYGSSFSQVPVGEMTSVLVATVKKKPIKEGQWVRIKRGPLKGDLARIVGLFEGGSKAFIQAVPRPDYSASAIAEREGKQKAGAASMKVRPQQRLFDAEEARLAGASFVYRRHHPLDNVGSMYDVWENDHYKDGFLFKEVNVSTYIDDSDVKPRLEELQLFRQRKAKAEDDDEDAPEDDNDEADQAPNTHFLKELADQIETLGAEEAKDGSNALLNGDLVQVTSGDMRNLIARIVNVNDATRIARIVPYNNALTTEMSIELDLLVKYIFPGAHVKVVSGRYMGQTGRVVSVKSVDGSNVAAILTDGINTEIMCNVQNLQMSSEVTTGYGNLMGYELYDIVALSENECAVVIVVGTEKLRVINHMGNVRDVLPMELLGKRNTFSARSTGFDVQQNVIAIGDTVKVTTGFHAKLSGTVKQMMKGTLWLHSNSYLKNSGIFVVKTRNCVVAGGKTATPIMSQSYKGVLLPATQQAGSNMSSVGGVTAVGAGAMGRGGSNSAGNRGGGRDFMIGKTVRITKGGHKGLLAQVVDATPTHYSVELLAKLKKIVVERNNTVFVGDEKGSLEKGMKNNGSGAMLPGDVRSMDISQTPYYTQDTPIHAMSMGTPHYALGSETPMVFDDSSRTPRAGGDASDSAWGVSDLDRQQREHSTSTSMQNSPGHSLYSSDTSRRGGSGWGSNTDSISGYSQSGTDNSAYSGNRYSQQGSGMSSLVQSGSSTPMSMMGEAGSVRSSVVSSSNSSRTGAGEVTFQDWTQDMVVVVKRGDYIGRWAVIQQRPEESGMVQLSLRDKFGGVSSGFSLHYTDLDLAPPLKKERAVVIAGKDKGKMGTVNSIQRNDIVIELDGRPNDPVMYRASKIAWINTLKK